MDEGLLQSKFTIREIVKRIIDIKHSESPRQEIAEEIAFWLHLTSEDEDEYIKEPRASNLCQLKPYSYN